METERTDAALAGLAEARIEACLSACEGVDTETLERMGEHALALTRDRLERYQQFTQRLLTVLVQVRSSHPLAPSEADLTLLDALRVEAALLVHQETVVRGFYAEH